MTKIDLDALDPETRRDVALRVLDQERVAHALAEREERQAADGVRGAQLRLLQARKRAREARMRLRRAEALFEAARQGLEPPSETDLLAASHGKPTNGHNAPPTADAG